MAWVCAPPVVTTATAVPATTVVVACSVQPRSAASDRPDRLLAAILRSAMTPRPRRRALRHAGSGRDHLTRTYLDDVDGTQSDGVRRLVPVGVVADHTAGRRILHGQQALSRCAAARAAWSVSRDLTRTASTGEPSTALTDEPTARIGGERIGAFLAHCITNCRTAVRPGVDHRAHRTRCGGGGASGGHPLHAPPVAPAVMGPVPRPRSRNHQQRTEKGRAGG